MSFLGFDALWNTPCVKFYNGVSVRLRIHSHPSGVPDTLMLDALLVVRLRNTNKHFSCRHYMKTSNRSHSLCNGPLTPVTSTDICNDCCLVPVTYKRATRPPSWPPQHSLPMWTSSNGFLKRPLHKFFVTDVKRAHYKCQTYQ
jgi:hypothetical protein